MELPEDFNLSIYRQFNDDLSKLNDSELEDHYINFGFKENRIYNYLLPEDFDWEIYLACNIDLKRIMSTKKEAVNHFIKFGCKEKRFINTNQLNLYYLYDWYLYKKKYEELKNKSYSDCFLYYITEGILKKHNIFLKKIDYTKIIDFFFNNISNLNYYQLFNKYDWSLYKENYKLNHLTSDFDVFLYYMKNGINNNHILEKNIVPITFFNYDFYKKINNINDEVDLLKEYILKEDYNRYYTIIEKYLFENFDWLMYLYKNDDLNNIFTTEIEGFKHFINCGINENREIYSNELLEKTYNWWLYKKNNSDLSNMSVKELIKHYIYHGKYEKRKLELNKIQNIINLDSNKIKNIINLDLNKINFDFYKSYYKDLNKIRGLNKIKDHYFENGIFEHRVINSELSYFDIHKNFLFFINQINNYNSHIFNINCLLYSSYHYNLYTEYDWYEYNRTYLKEDLFNTKSCIQHYLNNKSNEIFKKNTIKIDKNLYGIAISLYIDENTSYERVLRSKKCIESVFNIMSEYMI